MENLFSFYFVLLAVTYFFSWFNYFVLDVFSFELNEKRVKLVIVEGVIAMAFFVQSYECFVQYKGMLLNIFAFLIVMESANLILKDRLLTNKELTVLHMYCLIVSFFVSLYNIV
jgi:hypothetical protein